MCVHHQLSSFAAAVILILFAFANCRQFGRLITYFCASLQNFLKFFLTVHLAHYVWVDITKN